eukprot:365286-Chlamydomonas_euryale.AAC.7
MRAQAWPPTAGGASVGRMGRGGHVWTRAVGGASIERMGEGGLLAARPHRQAASTGFASCAHLRV